MLRCTSTAHCASLEHGVTGEWVGRLSSKWRRPLLRSCCSAAVPAAGGVPFAAAVVDDCGAACGPGDVQLNSFVFRWGSGEPAAWLCAGAAWMGLP